MPTNCLSVFDHFVGLALKGLREGHQKQPLEGILQNALKVSKYQIFYGVNLRIRSEYREIRTSKNSAFQHVLHGKRTKLLWNQIKTKQQVEIFLLKL